MLKYFLLWFPMLLLAILNGTIRDLGYKKYLGDLLAHQVSTVSLIILFTIYIFLIVKYFPPVSATQAIWIGIIWMMMTLAFEFGFGRWRGNSWCAILHDYNILEGRIWILIPIWLTIAPYILFKFITRH